ncbi:MAG: hypothetical protein ACPL5I_11085 [Thermodesulfobacteriota bacterium]
MKAVLRVLDSYSLIVYLEKENGADKMIELFRIARDSGKILLLISALPIQIVPVVLELTKQAAEFKAFKRMPYSNCFAALAKL